MISKTVLLHNETVVARVYRNDLEVVSSTFSIHNLPFWVYVWHTEDVHRERLFVMAHKWADATIETMRKHETLGE